MQDAGFRTTYLGGATLDFAGKGSFLRGNGYDLALGIDELPNATGHNWGMYDSDLFTNSKRLFDGLAEGTAPFMLTVLTLDTHHPEGTPSPGCAPYLPDPAVMLSAVHCSDQLVGDFIAHIRASPVADNTVIAIVSDHLLIQGTVTDALETQDRKLTFFVLRPSAQGQERAGSATHFDIAPTLLEAVGFSNSQFAFGQSLLTHDMGRAFERNLTKEDFLPFTVEALTAAKGG